MIVEESSSVLNKELENLLEIERKSRQENKSKLNLQTSLQIVELLWQKKDLKQLTHVVANLCTKKGQSMKTVTSIIQKCMTLIDQIPNKADMLFYVGKLNETCRKQIYLEKEYAKTSMILVKNCEERGDIEKAAEIISKVQIETFNSVSKHDKIDFILYQLKLFIQKRDWVKVYIIIKKINTKFLEDAGFELLKLTFYLYSFWYNKEKK